MRTTGYFDWCPECNRKVSVRADATLRIHGPVGIGCPGNRRPAPAFANATAYPWQKDDQK